FTPEEGEGMQPHLYNFVGKTLIEAGFNFSDGNFDLHDPLIENIINSPKEEMMKIAFASLPFANFMFGEIKELLALELRRINQKDEDVEPYFQAQLIDLMMDCVEPQCRDLIEKGEARLPLQALQYGIKIAQS